VIIHQPELITENDHTILYSRIELTNGPDHFPEFIWYRVPQQYGEFFTTQSDAFLVPGLLAGMYFGENIEVRGVVSPRLAYQIEEYKFLLHFRFPKTLHQSEIQYNRLDPIDPVAKCIGTTFSGGVDSFFTIWKHLPQNQPDPEYQITHGIFIKGFDILPSEDQHFKFLYEKYNQASRNIGIDLIPLETNVVSILHPQLQLPYFFGPIIPAAGIALAGGFRRFFIPSSWGYENLRKHSYTSDPLLDRLLSTETLEIIHHGSTHLRVDKIREIADWEIAQKLLWVCEAHNFEKDTWNCSRCEKCVRTMIPIYALGKLKDFSTFNKPFKSDREVLWWARKFTPQRDFTREIFPFVKKHEAGLTPWLRVAAALGVVRYWFFIRLTPGFIKKWLRRFGYFVSRNEAPDAYEIPEITQLIRENYDHPSTRTAQA
jgi:hypothetical protein